MANLRVLSGTSEIPAKVTELVRWRSLSDAGASGAVRAALVQVEIDPSSVTSLNLEWGAPRTANLDTQETAYAGWVSIASGVDGAEYPAAADVREPAVYAVFPGQWLADCGLRSFTAPVGAVPALAGYDASFIGSAHTAVNDVDPQVTSLINYTTDYEPWLFDRAMTLWSAYARTGDVKWLRHAHRASQFYAEHVGSDGYFDLRPGDLKYAYGQSMLVDLMLTGDTRLLPKIEAVASAASSWDESYLPEMNFWTERHQAYALLGALSAWEATGNATHGARAQSIISASLGMIEAPASGWTPNGCMLHQASDHEGVASEAPICSPWMSALFTDAVWRYYIHARDEDSLKILAEHGRFVETYGLYDGSGEGVEHRVPYYLASSEYQFTDSGAYGDWEHTCDVAGLMLKAEWARIALGDTGAGFSSTITGLVSACQENLDYWHRPGGPASGLSEWRLTPARKFNWWFGTTADFPYFLQP